MFVVFCKCEIVLNSEFMNMKDNSVCSTWEHGASSYAFDI